VVAHEDITARRLAEERIRFQAHVLDQVPAAVITTDPTGVVTHWNAHATTLYGWAPEEALGRPVAALTVRPTDQELGRAITARVATGTTGADASGFCARAGRLTAAMPRQPTTTMMARSGSIECMVRVLDE
jgi:PAS domain-containing protein